VVLPLLLLWLPLPPHMLLLLLHLAARWGLLLLA
jgi:hypothetical protein